MTHCPAWRHCLAVLLLSLSSTALAGQRTPPPTDQWIVTHSDRRGVSDVGMQQMTGNQGSAFEPVFDVIVAACVRHADAPSQWEFLVSRIERTGDYTFDGPERPIGWWQVGDEPPHGPFPITGYGSRATVYDDALTARLLEPVEDSLRLRIVQGNREWTFAFGPEGFSEAVVEFEAGCPI